MFGRKKCPNKNFTREKTFDFEIFGLKYVLKHSESIPTKKPFSAISLLQLECWTTETIKKSLVSVVQHKHWIIPTNGIFYITNFTTSFSLFNNKIDQNYQDNCYIQDMIFESNFGFQHVREVWASWELPANLQSTKNQQPGAIMILKINTCVLKRILIQVSVVQRFRCTIENKSF